MTSLAAMLNHPRVVIGSNGWPERIYSGIDWSLAQSSSKHQGEHLHWVCTMCKAKHHGSRAWAILHAEVEHGLKWDADSQCLFRPEVSRGA